MTAFFVGHDLIIVMIIIVIMIETLFLSAPFPFFIFVADSQKHRHTLTFTHDLIKRRTVAVVWKLERDINRKEPPGNYDISEKAVEKERGNRQLREEKNKHWNDFNSDILLHIVSSRIFFFVTQQVYNVHFKARKVTQKNIFFKGSNSVYFHITRHGKHTT